MIRRIALFLLAFVATPAMATLAPDQLASVGVSPPPGARMPAGLAFVDQAGRPVTIAPGDAPIVLLFADYTCRHLCGPGLTLTAGALHDAGLHAPADYRLVVIGMDGDGPAAARAFAASHLGDLEGEAATVRLLTGSSAVIARAEAALGYHAVYDETTDQFAHDAASFVLTPDLRLSHVLPETAVTADMIRGALSSAAKGETAVPQPSVIQQIATVCYGFAAAHGVHGAAIVVILRILGLLTLAAIGGGILRLVRRRRHAA